MATMTDPITARAMEFARQRLLSDMIARSRGITLPPTGPGTPLLPIEPSAVSPGGPAPPYWGGPTMPGVRPQPTSAPVSERPSQAPVPSINTEGMATGATTKPIQPQGKLSQLMKILSRPDMTDFLMQTGAAIGAAPQPGQSQMQQITQAIAGGVGGMRNAQTQRALMNFELEQKQREQGRKEQETLGELAVKKGQLDVNAETATAQAAQAKANLEQRKVEAKQEEGWHAETNRIAAMIAKGNIAEAEVAAKLHWAQLAVEKQKVDSTVAKDKADTLLLPRKMAVDEEMARAHKLQGEAALARINHEIATTPDKAAQAKLKLAGLILSGQLGIFGRGLDVQIAGVEGGQKAVDSMDLESIMQKVSPIVDNILSGTPVPERPFTSVTPPPVAAPPTPLQRLFGTKKQPRADFPPVGTMERKVGGRTQYKLPDGKLVDEAGQPWK